MQVPKEQLVASIASAREELDQALAALAKLPAFDPGTVGYAAHAISDYLTIVGATVDLLQAALAGHPDVEVQNWLERVRQATHVMDHTVTHLVNASAACEPQYLLGLVDMVRLVRTACDYYQTIAARKQIRISYGPAVETAFLRTDRCAVAAVVDNLLSNAVKYSDRGKRVRVVVAQGPAKVVCHVEDEGPGLSQEDHARLFCRGLSLTAEPTAGEPSSGFGLAIAKELVEKLGGRIWCESSLGHGARFSFSLPTATAGG
jgi:signal transduction histidine kinase